MFGPRFRAVVASWSFVVATACGGSSSPAPESPGVGSSDAVQISGLERFGWNQAADTIADYHFAVYVDNNRVELPSTVCSPASSGFACVSPLPPLTPGRHTLEVVSWIVVDGQLAESPRAPALNVNVTGISPSATQTAILPTPMPSSPPHSVARVSSGCGLAPLSTQEFLLWDASGSIRATDQDSGAARTLVWKTTDDQRWILSGLTPHPGFAKNGWLYLVQVAATGDPELRLSRYRLVGNVLGERAVLLQTSLDSTPERASVSFGPDGYLYVALLSTNEATQHLGARNDRFLIRVNDAGVAAPGDQAGSVFAKAAARNPVALAWAPDSAMPWVLSRLPDNRYAVSRLGDPQPVEDNLDPASTPIAMQVAAIDKQQVLYITGVKGDVRRLARDGAGWTLRDGFRLFDTTKAVRDALVLGSGDLAACGPTDGSGYSVWRVRLP